MTQSYQPAPFSAVPEAFGLYDPRFEHDGCGVSFICQIKGVASRSIVTDALNAPAAALLSRVGFRREAHHLENVWFKGAWGSELVFAVLEREWAAR